MCLRRYGLWAVCCNDNLATLNKVEQYTPMRVRHFILVCEEIQMSSVDGPTWAKLGTGWSHSYSATRLHATSPPGSDALRAHR